MSFSVADTQNIQIWETQGEGSHLQYKPTSVLLFKLINLLSLNIVKKNFFGGEGRRKWGCDVDRRGEEGDGEGLGRSNKFSKR